jgi:predicted Zn-dependent peptidase
LSTLEQATLEQIETLMRQGVSEEETKRAKRQLKARLVFENDSVTNIAHQLGYFDVVTGPGVFESLARRIDEVGSEEVSRVARERLARSKCTVGWFQPQGAAA